MAILSWSFRRQLGAISILAFFVLFAVGSMIYYFYPSATCFDNRRNQDETGIDCGGSCVPCKEQVKDFTILWSRFFQIRDEGTYDIAALMENRNQFFAAKKIVYAIKLYDKDNILISVKEGRTFANASERFVIFEPNFTVRNRIPVKSIVEIREVDWVSSEPKPLPINILKKNLLLSGTFPKLEVFLKNEASKDFYNIEATAMLYNASGDAVGASRTNLDAINIFQEERLDFTWPKPISDVVSAEIYLRSNP